MKSKNRINVRMLSILKSPLTLILCVLLGGFFGYYFSNFALKLNNIGDIYLRLLKMCVIPIIFTAISSRIAEMLLKQKGVFVKSLQKLCITIFLGFALVCITGVGGYYLTDFITKAFQINRTEMGKMIDKSAHIDKKIFLEAENYEIVEKNTVENTDNAFQITIKDYFPENIFEAFSQFYAIQIVIFSIFLGVTIGILPMASDNDSIIKMADSSIFSLITIYEIFLKMVRGILVFLPIGLFFMIAALVAKQQDKIIKIIQAMGAFIISFYIFGILIVLISSIIIWFCSDRKIGLFPTIFRFDILMQPILTSMFTMNSFATMPVAIETLINKLKFEKKSTNLYMSLFLPILRFGNAIYFIIATSFFAILYKPLPDLLHVFLMSLHCCFTSFTTIGTTSILAIQPITDILSFCELPSSAGLVLLIAIDALVDPMRTTLIVHCNTAVTAVMAEKNTKN